MASRRLRPDLSGDAGARRLGTLMEPSKEEFPFDPSPRTKKRSPMATPTPQFNLQPKPSSRIPQNYSQRRPSYGQSDRLPSYQASTLNSAGRAVSGRSAPSPPVSSPPPSRRPSESAMKNPRNVLRRKHSNLSQDTATTRNDSRAESNRTSSSSSVPRSQTSQDNSSSTKFDRGLTESPMEIRVAQKVELPKTTAHTVTIYPELDRYRDVRYPGPPASPVMDGPYRSSPGFEVPYRIATHDLPPPTPLFSGASSQISGFSASPSTRFSESPGPGPYSRDTTPTSISSQSPGLVAPLRIPAPRARQASEALTRPPVTRRRAGSIPNEGGSVSADPHGLAAVRESLTSSSSNSTVRDGDKKEKKKKKRLSPLPPSPPPRKSSQKFKKGGDEDESPSKPSREPAQPLMTAYPPSEATSSSQPRPAQSSILPAQRVTSPKATPPVRPSRDGTPDLHSRLDLPLPVIHSNLSSTSLSERRQSNVLTPISFNRAVTPSSQPDPQQQPVSRRPIGREPTPAPRTATSVEGRGQSQSDSGRSTRTPSPSVSTFKSRFPIFGRRAKTAPEIPQVDKSERTARKGPAAGTGHEGYGRLGSVRRRSNSLTSAGRPAPGSLSPQENLGVNQSSDPFLLERMAPVIIAGGEVIENRNTSSDLPRSESDQSFALTRSDIGSQNSSQVSLSSREGPRTTLWPSPFPRGGFTSRRPSDSSDSEALSMKPTLAFRRSMQRMQVGEQQPARMPKPIMTRNQTVSPSITSLDASIMSDDSIFDPSADLIRGRKDSQSTASPPAPKKLTKRTRSPRRWNFFGRSQSQPATVNKKVDPATKVAATVKVVQTKPVAFYTMMDSSEQEDVDTPDLAQVVREARGVNIAPPPASIPAPAQQPRERKGSITLRNVGGSTTGVQPSVQPPQTTTSRKAAIPSAVNAVQATEQLMPRAQQRPSDQLPPSAQVTSRPSRLPQVGRIPKVVSARPEQTSPKSFSRPFNRISIQMPPSRLDNHDSSSVAQGPSPPKPSTPDLTLDESTVTSGTSNSINRYSLSRAFSPEVDQLNKEFLSFSPRKNSQCTVTTTSSSSGLLTYADATAVVPGPNAPLVEDEIWDEYNDLFGEDTLKLPPSAGSSLSTPFHLEKYSSELLKSVEPALESPTLNHQTGQSLNAALQSEKEPPTSSVYSADMTAMIKEIVDASTAPETPFSVSEFVGGYGDRNNSVDLGCTQPTQQVVQQPEEDNNPPAPQPRRSDASGSSGGSEDNSPLTQVNLRVGSMTVSKWLTFGHVLFSPVRDEFVAVVGSLKRHSILVVDGLGNDDWSFYAAETYPAATFFNLSPRAPLPEEHRRSTTFPLSPPNHHQIQYVSYMDKFPFGPQSFTSVVFRFPPAAPESHYRNIIAEARRVLKPGGFIELSILDVDLNNMGNRGRRAVRRLKERIHAKAPDTSLGSTSDLILRLLGRKGFADIKTCRVGVPVASAIARSSGSEGSNGRKGTISDKEKAKPKPKDDRSLAEMMSDEGPVADESITKMVAKVGRWWYNRCYESAASVGPASSSGSSLWNDRALLAECEEWGTSLKLMVCHARVPDGRSRVASI